MAMAQRKKIGPEEMNGFHLLSTTNSVGPLVPHKFFIVFVHAPLGHIPSNYFAC